MITAQDLVFADRLLEAMKKKDRKLVAGVLADHREVTIQCATTRIETQYRIVMRGKIERRRA